MSSAHNGGSALDQIGFIGVGKIGLPICANLIERGVGVVGYRRGSLAELERLGGVPAASPAEVAERSDIVFSCLPEEAALAEVMSGPSGVIAAARPGQIFVELGSHPVPVKQRYVELLSARGASFLDGEVSGTPGMVEQRKAYIYVAGDAEAAVKVEPTIRQFSDLYIYLGAFGAASRVKLINNMLVALHIAGAAQAMAVGLKFGIDKDMLIEAVSRGSGGSTQFAIRAPWMADRRFLPLQGAAGGLLYYLEAFRKIAIEADVATDLVDNVIDIYQRAIPTVGERDVSALVDHFTSSP